MDQGLVYNNGFDLFMGFMLEIAFITFAFCAATLRNCIDEEKIRQETNIAKLFKVGIPPERVLTKAGRTRVKIAKISIISFVICVLYLVIRKLALE